MKLFYHATGLLAAFCLMCAILVTAVEAVVYWNDGYFEKNTGNIMYCGMCRWK